MATIQNNSDFLFIYEAINCNPNGDPDQENKPRMDYDTKTNLVTDVRLKRFIRDFLKINGHNIFVDMEGDSKVNPETKLKKVITRSLEDGEFLQRVFSDKPEYLETYQRIFDEKNNDVEKVLSEITKKEFKHKDVNFHLLKYLVAQEFIDIRMFGGAFAVPGFTHPYTGAIQINWGYSLNKVELIDSSSIVTIMSDESSTFGKDYRLHYSLLAFNGTMNKYAARSTGLSEEDKKVFRDSIWSSVSAMPTRSKLNQYPKLYVELVYDEGIHNGYFGDLRSHVDVKPKDGFTDKEVRKLDDLEFDTAKLQNLINTGKGKEIKEVVVRKSGDIDFPDSF
ncbi:MAG: type I-B CRISPR-associated protein Cas7/Csh2 [Bacteroidales bacterium]|nr:type I-B CRISPR-associated protein Cas7/Csh2 [Bacteroidales bacterium]